MASIVKRKRKYSVVYSYLDEAGEKKQKWESFGSHKEALKRKNEVEFQQQSDTFKPPTNITVRDLLYDFMQLYGKNNWALSTFTSNKSLIDNYINPIIGDVVVTKLTARAVEEYYHGLKSTPAVIRHGHKHRNNVSASTIHEINKILRCAFNQALKWELVDKNPVAHATTPKKQSKKRDIWTLDSIKKALQSCDDTKLALSLQLAFVCTLRVGEITGLQWDCVDISDAAIKADNASIYIQQELTRVSLEAMKALENKDIKFVFPTLRPSCVTRLVLKTPKTESSVRRIYIPKTLAYILRRWKDEQAELKEALGDDFHDFNLVVTHSNGRPVEHRLIIKALQELADREGLPRVVFHSLRHSSATYKLKLTNGSMKDLQAEGGWSTIEMIAKVYAHSIEEDRKGIAHKFDDAFYGGAGFEAQGKNPREKKESPSATAQSTETDLAAIISFLKNNPLVAKELRASMAFSD
jgi:integrase